MSPHLIVLKDMRENLRKELTMQSRRSFRVKMLASMIRQLRREARAA